MDRYKNEKQLIIPPALETKPTIPWCVLQYWARIQANVSHKIKPLSQLETEQ